MGIAHSKYQDGKLQFHLEWPNEYLNSVPMGEYHTNWIVKSIFQHYYCIYICVCVCVCVCACACVVKGWNKYNFNSNISRSWTDALLDSMAGFQIPWNQLSPSPSMEDWLETYRKIQLITCTSNCLYAHSCVAVCNVVCACVCPSWATLVLLFSWAKKICSKCSSLPSWGPGSLVSTGETAYPAATSMGKLV